MKLRGLARVALPLGAAGLLGAGCGSSSSSPATSAAATSTAAPATSAPATTGATATTASSTAAGSTASGSSSGGVLSAEATSAAAGDIPDNQVFLVFRNAAAGYSMKYPEGWAQQGTGSDVTFRDKNNVVHVTSGSGSLPSRSQVTSQLDALKARTPSLAFKAPAPISLPGATAVKVVYSTRSEPNSVTGKRVTLVVDRYYLAKSGKLAVVDLATPQGVDNVDAYRLMIESFRWK